MNHPLVKKCVISPYYSEEELGNRAVANIVLNENKELTVDEQVEDEEVSTQTDVEQDPIIEIKPVSFEDFKKIQWYMSFDEVCRILGTQPSEQEHTEEGLMVYTWYGKERNDDIVGYCKITFRMDYVYDFEADELL